MDSALLHKQDFDRRKDDPKVLREAWMGDVHQVHQKLVVGRSVVLSVYLSVAGEATLALQPEIPGREYLRVSGGDLRAFRTRSDDRNIASKDVEELRQLITISQVRLSNFQRV